jgi:ribonuclease Z
MQWSTSVLTQHSSDTEPTVVVNFDNAKYVFNVGENTSRSYVQSTQRFNKVRGIFISEIGTQRTAGLAGEWICEFQMYTYSYKWHKGYLMTLADMGRNSKVDIVGPEGLKHLLCSMRTYCLYAEII